MTTQQFIEKAIEGGWDRKNAYGETCVWTDGEVDGSIEEIVLLPEAWKAVGKVEGWKEHGQPCSCDECVYRKDDLAWNVAMHRMIDALAEGKTIEAYLETL